MSRDHKQSKAPKDGGFYFQPELIKSDMLLKASDLTRTNWVNHVSNMVASDLRSDANLKGGILREVVSTLFDYLLPANRRVLLERLRKMYKVLYYGKDYHK